VPRLLDVTRRRAVGNGRAYLGVTARRGANFEAPFRGGPPFNTRDTMNGLALMAEAWEAAGRPVSWRCWFGHQLEAPIRLSCWEKDGKRFVVAAAKCRICEQPIMAQRVYDASRYRFEDLRAAVDAAGALGTGFRFTDCQFDAEGK